MILYKQKKHSELLSSTEFDLFLLDQKGKKISLKCS